MIRGKEDHVCLYMCVCICLYIVFVCAHVFVHYAFTCVFSVCVWYVCEFMSRSVCQCICLNMII